jgi:hypothetical protein
VILVDREKYKKRRFREGYILVKIRKYRLFEQTSIKDI